MIQLYYKNPKFLIYWALLSVLGIAVIFQINSFNTTQKLLEDRFKTTQYSSSIKSNIEQIINTNIQTVVGLISVIRVNPNIQQDLFSKYAEGLFNQNTQLLNITGAPNMVVSMIHPIKGNEALIGLSYTQTTKHKEITETVKKTGQLVIEGPLNLIQGGEAFIGRIPVFLNNDTKDFWGIVSAVIDAKQFYNQANLIDIEEYEIALKGRDSLGQSGEIFFGNPNIFEYNPIVQTINLPNGSWQLALYPKSGWDRKTQGYSYLFSLLYSISIFLFIYYYQLQKNKEQRFNRLFTQSPIGIGLINSKSLKITEANNALLNQLNYNKNELQEFCFFELTITEDKIKEKHQIESLGFNQEGQSYQKLIQKKDGSFFPVIANNFYLDKKSNSGLICTFIQDISKEKTHESKLQESNEHLKAQMQILEAIRKLQSIALDEQNEVLNTSTTLNILKEVSQSQLCIININPNQDSLKQVYSLNETDKDFLEFDCIKDLTNKVIEKKCAQTTSIKTETNSNDIQHILITPIMEQNNLISLIILGRKNKIFETKFIQWLDPLFVSFAQVIQSHNYKQSHLNAQNQLILAKESAEKSSLAKSEFLAIMSHEIRTPINGIMGMLNLLNKTELTSTQKHKIDVALSSSQSLLTVINDILDFSKIEANKIEIEKRSFSLKTLMSQTKDWFDPIATNQGLKLIIDCHNLEHNNVIGDMSRIKQIITNLVNNALKFTHCGQIEIKVDSKITNTGIKFHFGIQDSGIGIDKKEIEQLFNPFVQADISTTRKYGGTGLGLAICKKLCLLMNGNIWVTSKINKGSCFQFYIHLDKDISNSKSVVINEEVDFHEYNDKFKILLVEDNFVNQEVITMTLKELGLDSHVVENGQLAIEHLKTNKQYNLIFMDCQMPVKDGFQTTSDIRNGLCGHIYKKTKIIALTANAMKGDKEKCFEYAMDDYLTKPIEELELRRVLNEFVNNGFK